MTKHMCHCGRITDAPTCSQHGIRKRDRSAHQRGYGRQWRNVRRDYLAQQPTCEDCAQHGITRLADEVHHIIPMAQSAALAHNPNNLAALCEQCHHDRHNAAKQA